MVKKFSVVSKEKDDLEVENKVLKAELEIYKSNSIKQQSQAHNNPLEGFVEQYEARKEKKENIFLKKTELTGLEKFKEHQQKMREQIKEDLKEKKEEESNTKKRGFGRSR